MRLAVALIAYAGYGLESSLIERIPFEDEDEDENLEDESVDEVLAMMRQLIEEAVQAEINRTEEGVPLDDGETLLIDASSLEEDESGTLLGVKQARLTTADAALFCENEVPGGAARYHAVAADRRELEWTIICRIDQHVVIANAGPDGVSSDEDGDGLGSEE